MTVVRSSALTTKDTGPIADHWIMLAEISTNAEVDPPYLVHRLRPEKNSTIQVYTASGMFSVATLRNRVAWRTVSNALLKSRTKTITDDLLDSKFVTECRMPITATWFKIGLRHFGQFQFCDRMQNANHSGGSAACGTECILVTTPRLVPGFS